MSPKDEKEKNTKPSALGALRVLDLTDEKGSLCGKILGDLGADVIKVEKPSGDPARRIGPFYGNIPDPEKSLHWFAFNSSKRGITLNLEAGEGQELFKKLSSRADVVIESFLPGHLKTLGLGYGELSARNPGLIMTSITPFGQTGPRRHEKASDITLMAMSGLMSITGDPDKPPLRMSLDQSYSLAGAHAAAGTLLALWHRRISGEGQQVDVSIYECVVRGNYWEPSRWEFLKILPKRMGNQFARVRAAGRQLWRCKDGYVTWLLMGGDSGARLTRAFVDWMDETGQAGIMKEIDWDTVHVSQASQEELKVWEEIMGNFLREKTLDEIETEAFRRGIPMARVNEADGVARDVQLASRAYWKDLPLSEPGKTVRCPAFPYLSSEADTRTRRPAPRIGEHNAEVYGKELGFTDEHISALRKRGVL
jgi:crotonobetainyl-CoA:carnitine CoA-transferase CaiB-like acyl-CoA transferase